MNWIKQINRVDVEDAPSEAVDAFRVGSKREGRFMNSAQVEQMNG